MSIRKTLRRWHIWLGWLVGVPMLLWTLSGVVMVARPIEEVRGSNLIGEPGTVALAAPPALPNLAGLKLSRLSLEPRATGPRWVVRTADGTARLADPVNGSLLPALSAADAAREVTARYTGSAKVATVARTDKKAPPLDFRRSVDAWAVTMDDGTRFYVDRWSGEIAATRTRWWRIYDFMWGLHIMDLETREDTHHPWIIVFGVIALITTLMALVMLPLTGKRRRKSSERPAQ
jgi:hypothetical protein